jgi:NAD(P)H-nitrite reductase large subunit
LNRAFRPRPGLWEGVEGEVAVCRCEEVRAGEIRTRVRNGCTSPKALKDWTRAGMGLCQGRVCGAVLSRLVAEETGRPLEAIPPGSVRPPVKPLPVQHFVVMDEP